MIKENFVRLDLHEQLLLIVEQEGHWVRPCGPEEQKILSKYRSIQQELYSISRKAWEITFGVILVQSLSHIF